LNTTPESLIFERFLKKTTITNSIISIVLALVTAIAVVLGFYYNTKSTINAHTIEIKEIKIEVKSLNDVLNQFSVLQNGEKEQIKALQDQIVDVKKSQERIENKIDKLIMR
jgi:predicted PurR-regulated permease PerM